MYIHKTAEVAPTAFIDEGCIIGKNTQIRHCAFLRGNVIVGDGCVIGNSTEVKNSVIFDGVQIPHYNYVGDSILGYKAHLGAGAIISNVKSDKSDVTVDLGQWRILTGMRKLGAMVGDFAEIGCSCVLNPGTVVMPHSNVYPLTSVRGYVPGRSIVKAAGVIVEKR